MGHVPVPPLPTSARMFLALYERRLQREMLGRTSRFSGRRRRAHAACLALIRAREADLGWTPDPWKIKPPPKPADARILAVAMGTRTVNESRRGQAAA